MPAAIDFPSPVFFEVEALLRLIGVEVLQAGSAGSAGTEWSAAQLQS